jgi:hypothetical protein
LPRDSIRTVCSPPPFRCRTSFLILGK